MSRRQRRSKEMAPEERLAGLAAVTAFMVIGWFLWLPKDTSALFPISILALLGVFWWVAIKDFQAVRKAYATRRELSSLSPEQFEQWCANRLRELGYTVRHVGGQGDHGIDLFAEKDGERVVVQCKRFTGTRSVGEPQIRDLFGAMHAARANGAIVVTAGYFTAEARAWAHGKPIELWDVDRILRSPSHSATTPAVTPPTAPAVTPPTAPAVTPPALPSAQVNATVPCAQCGSEMLVRRNRSSGQPFYGCSRYPGCRYTRPMEATASGAS
ncbi:MAG: restriction endonuclease [Chloroflexota bacterium]